MRSVMEMVVRNYYGGSGSKLEELIDSVANRLRGRANAAALHRLRRLANRILHGDSDKDSHSGKPQRDLELEVVSLLFALRALIENAPQFTTASPRNFR
jgi:hypothetical protein